MHSLLLVLVPSGVADVSGFVREQLEPHRHCTDDFRRFDYFVIGGLFDGRILPPGARPRRPHSIENNLCPVRELDPELPVGGILLPDGAWIDGLDLSQPRWREYLRAILDEHQEASLACVDIHC